MKFQTVFSFLFVGTSFADAASFGKDFGEPKCVLFDTIKMESKFDTITMEGGVEFVDTDGSGFPLITTGDMSIGEKYTGVEGFGVPTQYGGFNNVVLDGIQITYKSICVITRDQDPPSSPTCFYEFELGFCPRGDKCRKGRFTAHGSGPRNLQITGGSDDFFGAYGQIGTPTAFAIEDIDPVTGDILRSSIDMDIELCFYDRNRRF
uniref:C3H1-type domain-containing protein n=1 Tax=Chaetoceros debilis TaxID=122233 RepID=A0A7S3VB34_9STRA|mmetsp:Transcript_9438/g.14140  ORF Transcript_9438/g.14140 Transcript_9438/m.14140 type:complete len:206 (+) Transcript_9438:216-833(+)